MTAGRRLMLYGPRNLRLDLLTVPEPDTGQVLIQTSLSAVSVASELGLVVGREQSGAYPHGLGYQSVGWVLALGAGVADFALGDRVVGFWGHASHTLSTPARLISVPAEVPDRIALAAVLGEETMHGIRKLALPQGSRVLVAGAGLLGLLSVFNLTRRGSVADVLEPLEERRELARDFGASGAWTPEAAPATEYAFGVDCSASPAGFAALVDRMAPGGRVCVLSDGNWGALTLPPAFHRRELTVMGSSDGEDYGGYARWLWAHADPVLARLFGHTIAPNELPGTFAELEGWPRPVSVAVRWS